MVRDAGKVTGDRLYSFMQASAECPSLLLPGIHFCLSKVARYSPIDSNSSLILIYVNYCYKRICQLSVYFSHCGSKSMDIKAILALWRSRLHCCVDGLVG